MAAMAASLLCLRPTMPPLSSSFTSDLPSFSLLRSQTQTFEERGKCHFPKRNLVVAASSQKPTSGNGLNRRDLVLFSLSSSAASLVFPSAAILASTEVEEEVKVASFIDDINAYSFQYPTEFPSKNFLFKWVVSRKPERYSSAAPLSPDARQRIVSERVDMINNLVISVSIGPPNSSFLTSSDKSTWSAKAVADSVLSDKSALRVTTSQRLAESSVLDTHVNTIDGELYWYHEYLVRKSPTKLIQESNTYRHFVASTAERDGYLFTLSASTLSKQWPSMGPFLQKTVDSFRLLPPTENYVPPYKDPWRFW